ncbi:ATP-binding cassette domain-containing protein [Niabella pedocola]|uniref:ATP-binding cassette domain-containing protein n=1 Tax=Niabella pedocola TaxID=1752077 RepID=A0ABS8PU79_9BACT|nr:ATP-binding cassette domain-containing protein [Niabella pedocola]MCD2424619.1 ATP-binding cassette domain-containing protein [Niabella pedocola]
MGKTQTHILEAAAFFTNNDTVPGFRKLMDLAMDTQDMAIYREAIALTDWNEQQDGAQELFIQKCRQLLDTISRIPITEYEAAEPVVEATEIRKNYGRGTFALGPVSLSIRKGAVYGLVGENGNGKTTLLRILAKDLACNSGSLRFHFRHPAGSAYDLRTKLVYIPQRTQRWYGSLKDNLKLVLTAYGVPASENETRVLMMIARLGLWKYRHLKWNELSSGYKMRFELARTLLRKPELLLLDEPLANLDIVAQQVILEDLRSIANSVSHPIALILSSQQLYEVEKVSNRVIFLRNGVPVETQGPETGADPADAALVVEMDCNSPRATLQAVLETLPLDRLHYNGGVYIAYFKPGTSFLSVLETLGKSQCQLVYIRDISSSTRRLFMS